MSFTLLFTECFPPHTWARPGLTAMGTLGTVRDTVAIVTAATQRTTKYHMEPRGSHLAQSGEYQGRFLGSLMVGVEF